MLDVNAADRPPTPTVAVVVPVYNEAAGLAVFHQSLAAVLEGLPYRSGIWYVDDGSADETVEVVAGLMRRQSGVHLIELSRNFGHQAALTAGLDHAHADVVIVMDGDGQHPPSLIPEMLRLHEAGYDIVLTQREETTGSGFWKRTASRVFYGILNATCSIRLAPNAADFRLMSRRAAEALTSLREYHRFLRGMVSWIGFRQIVLPYVAPARIAGQTKYSLRKMLALASHALFSFSRLPLRICFAAGSLLCLLSLAEGLYTTYLYFSPRRAELVPGWSSLIFFLLLLGGVQLLMLGVLGHYISYIFEETKRRPPYIVRRITGAGQREHTTGASAPGVDHRSEE